MVRSDTRFVIVAVSLIGSMALAAAGACVVIALGWFIRHEASFGLVPLSLAGLLFVGGGMMLYLGWSLWRRGRASSGPHDPAA